MNKNLNNKKQHTLLLIDDEKDILFAQRAIFQLDPTIRIISAYNGLQALDHLIEKRAFEDGVHIVPELIICDLVMPVIDGIEFLEKIKMQKNLKNIPVYILTSHDKPETREKMIQLGAIDCIAKPIDQNELKKVIENILKKTGCLS